MSETLAALAHEINVRLQKADDHRLSASLKLAEAAAACRAEGVSFKSWVAAEIRSIAYPEATRLAKIGAAPDPAKALADAREKARVGMRSVRAERVANVSNSSAPLAQIAAPVAALPRPGRGKEAICARVADALAALSGLPPAAEVAGFFKGTDGAVIVDENIGAAARWLAEFHELWSHHAETE